VSGLLECLPGHVPLELFVGNVLLLESDSDTLSLLLECLGVLLREVFVLHCVVAPQLLSESLHTEGELINAGEDLLDAMFHRIVAATRVHLQRGGSERSQSSSLSIARLLFELEEAGVEETFEVQ